MPYINKNIQGHITGVYACEQYDDQEFVEVAELYTPAASPLQQIRVIEARPEHADAMARASRQLLLHTWFTRAKAMPAAALMTKEQIEAYCRANDKTYKALAEAEDAIKLLRTPGA